MAGRKRSSKNMPKHIEVNKLPKGIYWDDSGTGHWYISFFDANNKQRRKRVAGGKAVMSDLHRIIEAKAGVVRNTFDYISTKYFESDKYKKLAVSTQKQYKISFKQISKFQTKSGTLLGSEPLSKWSTPLAQRLTDHFAENRGPTAANHAARFAKRVFNWSISRGHANTNPYKGIEMAEEEQKRILPKKDAYYKILDYSKELDDSYIWMVMELAYMCVMRGVEVLDLTDENELENGLLIERRKGSKDTIVRWTDRLRKVWDAAKSRKNNIQNKKRYPIPLKKEERYIFVTKFGGALDRSSLNSAWQRIITKTISLGIISKEDRFSIHDLKRMGVTDTKGNQADKQQTSGHKSAAMVDIYNCEISVVNAVSDDE